ncbi:hypothetical protein GEMRC1_007731 [Eukaryota sp. GEM-RC1]
MLDDNSHSETVLHGDTKTLRQSRTRVQKLHTQQIRLVIQALESWGFPEPAKLLSDESGIQAHAASATIFRQHVLDGKWDKAVDMLPLIPFDNDIQHKIAKVLLLRRKLIDAISLEKPSVALSILRTELAPITSKDHLHSLSTLLMCELSDIPKRSLDIGICGDRITCLSELNHVIPSHFLLPERQLETLLSKALSFDATQSSVPLNVSSLSLIGDLPVVDCNQFDTTIGSINLSDELWRVRVGGDFLCCSGRFGATLFQNFAVSNDRFTFSNRHDFDLPDDVDNVTFSPNFDYIALAGEESFTIVDLSNFQEIFKIDVDDLHLEVRNDISSVQFFEFNDQLFLMVTHLSSFGNSPVYIYSINGAEVRQVKSFPFLSVRALKYFKNPENSKYDCLFAMVDVEPNQSSLCVIFISDLLHNRQF